MDQNGKLTLDEVCIIRSRLQLDGYKYDLDSGWIQLHTNQTVSRRVQMGSKIQVDPASYNPENICMDPDGIYISDGSCVIPDGIPDGIRMDSDGI